MGYLPRYAELVRKLGNHEVTIAGITIEVDQNVFSPDPKLTHSSSMILNNLPNVKNKSVLDLGSGSGILSIYSALNGAKNVTAVDIDERAVLNTKKNVQKYSLEEIVDVRRSDLFDNVDGQYDLILANLPILNLDLSERLLREAPAYLNEDGKLQLVSAQFGKVTALSNLSDGWTYHKHTKRKFGIKWHLYSFTPRKNQWLHLAADYQKKNSRTDDIGYGTIMGLLGECSGKKILDYGCGSGDIAKLVSEKGAMVTGVDISEEAIRSANKKSLTRASFSTTSLYVPQPYFYDLAMLNFVVCCVEDNNKIKKIFSQIYSQLKSQGQLLILEPHPNSHHHRYVSSDRSVVGNLQEGSKIKVKLAGMDSSFYDYWRSKHFYLNSLKEVGFSSIDEFYPLASGSGWLDETRYPPFMVLRARK